MEEGGDAVGVFDIAVIVLHGAFTLSRMTSYNQSSRVEGLGNRHVRKLYVLEPVDPVRGDKIVAPHDEYVPFCGLGVPNRFVLGIVPVSESMVRISDSLSKRSGLGRRTGADSEKPDHAMGVLPISSGTRFTTRP